MSGGSSGLWNNLGGLAQQMASPAARQRFISSAAERQAGAPPAQNPSFGQFIAPSQVYPYAGAGRFMGQPVYQPAPFTPRTYSAPDLGPITFGSIGQAQPIMVGAPIGVGDGSTGAVGPGSSAADQGASPPGAGMGGIGVSGIGSPGQAPGEAPGADADGGGGGGGGGK